MPGKKRRPPIKKKWLETATALGTKGAMHTVERDAAIRRELEERGRSKEVVKEIAEREGIKPDYIRRLAPMFRDARKPKKTPEGRGGLFRERGHSGKRLTVEDKKKFYVEYEELREKGIGKHTAIKELAKKYGIGGNRMEDIIENAEVGYFE